MKLTKRVALPAFAGLALVASAGCIETSLQSRDIDYKLLGDYKTKSKPEVTVISTPNPKPETSTPYLIGVEETKFNLNNAYQIKRTSVIHGRPPELKPVLKRKMYHIFGLY